MRAHDSEKRYVLAPVLFKSSISSAVRLYESQATSPEVPSQILPGVWAKTSQMVSPLPSVWGAPSIW